MKALSLRICEFSIALIALARPAFGGRMLETAGPPELRVATQPEATEAAVTESADEEGAPAPDDAELKPEESEDHGEVPVEAIPAAPPSRWKWSESVSVGVSTDDNINLSADHREADQLLTLGAHLELAWGLKKEDCFLVLDYSPSLILFAQHSGNDAFNQRGAISGQWRFTKLTLGAELHGQTLSGGDTDVGDRAQRFLWQVALKANYDYSPKTSFEVTLEPNASDYSKYLSSLELTNGYWIDYQLLPKTRVGAGVTLGYLKPEGGPAQTYEQALLRVSKPLSGKVSFHANGGVELRQLGGDGGTQTTPVFKVGLDYRPFDGTDIELEASRRIYSSATLADRDFTTTGGTVSVRQRLFQRFQAAAAVGYEDAQYTSTNGASAPARHDQYLFVRPSVSFAFTKWMNIELYYEHRHNASTDNFSLFESNVAGAQATLRF